MSKVGNAVLQVLRFLGGSTLRGNKCIQHECHELLDILGIQVQIKGLLPSGPCLIVANHRSFLDILALGQLDSMVFVTSQEVGNAKFTGLFSKLAGCIFVERRNYSTLLKDIDQIKAHLQSGRKVCFFPEATTTDGTVMAKWRSSLFEAAVRASAPVVPVAIDYTSVNGQKLANHNWHLLYYIGEMTFYEHVKNVFSIKNAHIKMQILKPMIAYSRKILAYETEAAIKDALHG